MTHDFSMHLPAPRRSKRGQILETGYVHNPQNLALNYPTANRRKTDFTMERPDGHYLTLLYNNGKAGMDKHMETGALPWASGLCNKDQDARKGYN